MKKRNARRFKMAVEAISRLPEGKVMHLDFSEGWDKPPKITEGLPEEAKDAVSALIRKLVEENSTDDN